ncbi:hypothetical protein B0H15DRAFT_949505 [Mycena belliarum]|uniref:Uncharacterized protein n=1 Tax=Mycena belliarum TaxID=1033014 RepID=A0AAD6U8N3_9AGAR|nr:hypothetical protein B0H15DRAFT_949505 [Mycena belliae]
MAPKRVRQSSTAPDEPSKRLREVSAGPLSPITDMSDTENSTQPDATVTGVGNDTNVSDHPTDTVVAPAVQTVGVVEDRVEPVLSEAGLRPLLQFGVEPGALVGADAKTLNAILATVLQAKVGAGPLNEPVSAMSVMPGADLTGILSTGVSDPDGPDKEAALGALVGLGVSPARVAHWSAAETRRLAVVLNRADTENNIYSILKAPGKKDWGIAVPFDDTSNVLCLDGTGTPITFWIPGEVSAQYWFDNEGYPAQRPAFGIQPMVDHMPEFCKTQLHELCMPTGSSKVAEQMGPGQVKASRWMNERGKKGQPSKTLEFKAVYDARKSLRGKHLLQQLSVGQLQLHDIVVMELRIHRYPVRDDAASDATKGKCRAMEKWQAYYDLQAVYKFKDATDAIVAKPAVADFEI